MVQNYFGYSDKDHQVWTMLFDRQRKILPNRASSSYIDCLDRMVEALHGQAIPDFNKLNRLLEQTTGFEVVVVPGLIEVKDFFGLLADRKFPSSIWLREMSQLDYLAEPDMFHDIFGHIPLLMNEEYAQIMQKFGEVGLAFAHDDKLTKQLQRLYWFTVEFGMIQEQDGPRIYGAGIMSSFKETKHVFKPEIVYHPFDLMKIIDTDFDYTDIQVDYFVIDNYDQMFQSLIQMEELGLVA